MCIYYLKNVYLCLIGLLIAIIFAWKYNGKVIKKLCGMMINKMKGKINSSKPKEAN